MKKLFAACLIALLVSVQIFSQQKTKEVVESMGGFSYSIPSEWTLSKMDGMDYQIARDKISNGFYANINVLQEKNNFSFAEYIKQNILQLKEYIADYQEINTEDFVTDTGIKGKKHTCSDKQGGKSLYQSFYFFEKKDKTKIIITGTSLLEDREKYAPVFDAIVKSYKLIKK